MEIVPIEMVEKILSYLDLETLEEVDSVCVNWSNIISINHFHPYLAAQEHSIRKYLTRNGWTPSCSDIGLITKLFKKVRQRIPPVTWVSSWPTVRTRILVDKHDVSICNSCDTKTLVYKDKLYLSGCCTQGKVEVYCLETLERIHTLEKGEDEVKDEINKCGLRRHGRFGVVCTGSSPYCGFSKIWLYNLETDELVGRIETTEPFSCLVMNDTMLVVCSFDFSCRSWVINSSLTGKVESQPKEICSSPTHESRIHKVTINNVWLVTLVEETASETDTFQVRHLGPGAKMGQIQKLECVAFTETYVGHILLNENNLMAVLEQDEHPDPDLPEDYDVLVINIVTDTVVVRFNDSVFQTNISWRNNWLFVKKAFGNVDPDKERLGTWWNAWTGEEDNIDVVEEESWTNREFPSYQCVEVVEAARHTEVHRSYKVKDVKITVYDFWNVSDTDARDEMSS